MNQITSSRTLRLLFTVLFCLVSVAAVAQSAGFGAVSGVVLDATGAVVPGAHVNLDNPSKGIHREMDTTNSGNFDFQNLVPASGYTVKVAKPGFAAFEYKDVTVEVGGNTTLSPRLGISTQATQVEVTSQAPVVDFAKTDTSTVVGSDQILELPINGRRVDNFVLLTPGVSTDGAFGLLSFRGNPGGNAFLTDGVDTTNSYYGENAGRTRTYNISQDAVQEFQVVSSNYAAEFGKASGGVVNTVTRSGSNSYHGSAYEFFRNATLNAKDRTTVSGLAPNGINPPEWRHQAGLSIGGPIKKDKLFFFFNGELFRRNAPAVSSNIGNGAGNNLFDGAANYKTGQTCVPGGVVVLPSGYGTILVKQGTATTSPVYGVAGPTAAQCAEAQSYVKSRVIPQLIPRTMNNNMLFGKIDWHPTEKDSVSFSSNYLDFDSPNGIQTQLSLATGAAIGNNGDTTVHDRTGRASWTRVISNNKLNELRFGLFKDRQVDPAAMGLLPTFSASAGSTTTALSVNSVSNLGFATNYPRVNPSELRIEFADNFSWTTGKHSFKFGGNFTHLEDYVESMPSQYPTYTYNAFSNGGTTTNAMTLLALDIDGNAASTQQAWTSFSQTVGNRQVDLKLWETSLYAQDEWHLTPKFTVSPGIRFEHSTVPQPDKALCNPAFPGTCNIPSTWGSIAPRLGLAYAVDSKTAIHAGYGIFYNRYTTSTIENLLVTNGLYQKGYSYNAAGQVTYAKGINGAMTGTGAMSCLPSFPLVEPWTWTPAGGCAKTLSPNVIFADPNFKTPYSQQANLAIEREIAKNTSLSVSYVWSRSLGIPVTKDLNVLDPTQSITYHVLDAVGNLARTYTTPIYTQRNPAYIFNGVQYTGRVSELQSGGNSYYNALLVNLNRRQGNWFQGSISYTYGHTIDQGVGFAPTFGSTTPSSYINGYYAGEKGSSQLDRRQNLVINAVFSPTFMHSNGWLAKQVVNGWQLGIVHQDASGQPSPAFYSGSVSIPSSLTTVMGLPTGTNTLFSGSLNGLGGTGRIPFESLSTVNIGAIYRTDARVTKTFTITERWKVMAGFEAWNIFNHLIPSGRDTSQYSVSFPTSTTDKNYGFGVLTPRSSFNTITATQITPDGTTARRAQAVIRINF